MSMYNGSMLSRLIISLVLSLLLVAGSFNSGFVVCYGDDGHVAVEISDGADCNDHVEATGHENPELQANHCGPCTDVPLLTATKDNVVPTPTINLGSVFSAAPIPVYVFFSPCELYIVSLPQPPPFTDPTLDSRQSIVLLI